MIYVYWYFFNTTLSRQIKQLLMCLFCKPAVIINQFNRKLSDLNVPKESIAFSSLEEKHFRHFERKTFETVLRSYMVLHEHLTNYPPKDGYQSVLLDAMTLEFQVIFTCNVMIKLYNVNFYILNIFF
ncbi:UNVERIFIED_CONTAM: hypothetical protein NCL1_21741 [Trichonephila clavipes]